ncbi:hypothetical protein RS1P1_37960 [Pseudomonas moraviensis]|nr:hypothetical protein RS1P1_37960 [Pseudomonas moraviensis]
MAAMFGSLQRLRILLRSRGAASLLADKSARFCKRAWAGEADTQGLFEERLP